MKTWDELKQQGSLHYKTGGVELIDLWKAMKPDPSLSVFDVFALCGDMKYACRQLQRGLLPSDIRKVRHLTELLQAAEAEVSGDGKEHIVDANKMVYPPIVKGNDDGKA
ncbi:MAG: DUF3310 domain-containing protein [Planctomycetes bacterium]|nr:DUF3310 domain-containing protein [Planctomycetota bacterium]